MQRLALAAPFLVGTFAAPFPQCVAPDALVGLDHVVVAVRDLDRSTQDYLQRGFTIKDGRLHPNGLSNRHIKFLDGTSIELMSLVGSPGDEMALAYSDFLAKGEGGIYLALAANQRVALSVADQSDLEADALNSGGFRYLTFSDPALAGLFFIEYESPVEDPESLLHHQNGANGIEWVVIEGGSALERLLLGLGAVPCGAAETSGVSGTRYALRNGSVIVVPPSQGEPRVLEVSLRGLGAAATQGLDRWASNGMVIRSAP